MHKNPLWLCFLFALFSVTAWYSGKTAMEYYSYQALTEEVLIDKLTWSVLKESENTYHVQADYSYKVSEKDYQNTVVIESSLRNSWAAKQLIEANTKKTWHAYFPKNQPERSTIEKVFPLKGIMSSLILISIFFYFIWLGYYVQSLNKP